MNLSNANLLEPLANGNLKNQRLQKTHLRAINPSNEPQIVEENSNFSGNEGTIQQPVQPQMQQPVQNQAPSNWKPEPQQLHVEHTQAEAPTVKTSDDKILGMPPMLFYGLAAVAAAGIGYLIYKSVSNKKATTQNLKPIAGGVKPNVPTVGLGEVVLKKVA